MKRVNDIFVILILIVFCGSFSSMKMQAKNYSPKLKANSTVEITRNWDLKGKTVVLPDGITLNVKNGEIKNGTLVGKKTKLAGKKTNVFNKVNIEGSWNVSIISSSLFVNLSEDNALRNVMALTDTSVRNVVTIEKGTYSIKLTKNQETGLYVRSNTTLILNGTIRLKPNSFTNYHVVEATGNNIVIKGTGSIVGDKDSHTGKSGEWGMGLDVARGNNVRISGLIIKDCWGDCIYIGDKSKNVTIEKCTLINGRRQGVSITEASNVEIKDSKIYNIGGVEPGFAIDVETNKGTHINKVRISGVVMHNCKGGIQVNGHAPNSSVTDVSASNCTVYGMTGPLNMVCYNSSNVMFKNNKLDKAEKKCVKFQDCSNYKIINSSRYEKTKNQRLIAPLWRIAL